MQFSQMDDLYGNIPPYFLCPISLQVMEDPVTVSTGVSYDRRCIARWLADHRTCPVTNQLLTDLTLTPNSTLLRLIQAHVSSSPGACGRAPAKTGFDVTEILGVLRDPAAPAGSRLKSLKKIQSLAQQDDGAQLEETGVVPLVASVLAGSEEAALRNIVEPVDLAEEAAAALHALKPSPETIKAEAERDGCMLVASLASLLHWGSFRGRAYAALLLRSIFDVASDKCKEESPVELIEAAVETLKDQNSSRGVTLALLTVLADVLPHGKNRMRAVEAGAVTVAVELLVEESGDRRKCEALLYVLEVVCKKAEGRAELVAHPAGVAAVVAKMLCVSGAVTERAVRVLRLLCKHCGGKAVVDEMMHVGGVAKLCLLVQVEGGRRSREMTKEILALHLNAWKKFPCFPSYCLP